MPFYHYQTSNPVFTQSYWRKTTASKRMSLAGIFIKTMCCLLLLSGGIYLMFYFGVQYKWFEWFFYGGMLMAIVFSGLTYYRNRWSWFAVPFYATSKGFFLGGIVLKASLYYPGYPQKALLLTIITALVMLLLYQLGWVQVNRRFRSVLFGMIGTIMSLYVLSWLLHFVGVSLPFLYDSSPVSIAFSILVSGVAAFSLLLDFSYIERKVNRAPKYMEWVATWGLLVTLIWLYVELLRLMKKAGRSGVTW